MDAKRIAEIRELADSATNVAFGNVVLTRDETVALCDLAERGLAFPAEPTKEMVDAFIPHMYGLDFTLAKEMDSDEKRMWVREGLRKILSNPKHERRG